MPSLTQKSVMLIIRSISNTLGNSKVLKILSKKPGFPKPLGISGSFFPRIFSAILSDPKSSLRALSQKSDFSVKILLDNSRWPKAFRGLYLNSIKHLCLY